MDLQQASALALGELRAVFSALSERDMRPLLDAIRDHQRIFTIGAGREGLSTKAFAMRLTHLGKESHWIWDDTTPGIGKGDLLIATCGSGNIDSICDVMRKAKGAGAKIAVVTASAAGRAVDIADIVARFPAAAYKAEGELVATAQPMGNLFEQGLYILFDLLIMLAAGEMGISAEDMEKRHRNVE